MRALPPPGRGAALTEQDGFTRYPKGHAGLLRGLPARGGDLRQAHGAAPEAKRRIAEDPGKYFEDRVYGEIEGGGTQVLYLSHVPFEKLGLPKLGNEGVPRTAYSIQEGLYKGFIAPVAAYAVLAGVMLRNRRANRSLPARIIPSEGGHQSTSTLRSTSRSTLRSVGHLFTRRSTGS